MSVIKFLWQTIKPYKWWYLLMFQAPFFNAIYVVFFNYSIKLLIDLFTQHSYLTFSMASKPLFYFIGGALMHEVSWRFHNFSSWKVMPKVYQNLFLYIFKYIMGHSYLFFQNTQGGTITSKARGIDSGYIAIHNNFEYSLSKPILCVIFTGLMLCFVNINLFLIVVIFSVIFIPIALISFNYLGNLEMKREESFHKIFGIFADCVTNVFTIFAFSSKEKEYKALEDYYNKTHTPLVKKWHRDDFFISCLLVLIMLCFIFAIFFYAIILKNKGLITNGDVAITLSLTYLFTDFLWAAVNQIKNFFQDWARLSSALSILQTPQNNLDKSDAVELVI